MTLFLPAQKEGHVEEGGEVGEELEGEHLDREALLRGSKRSGFLYGRDTSCQASVEAPISVSPLGRWVHHEDTRFKRLQIICTNFTELHGNDPVDLQRHRQDQSQRTPPRGQREAGAAVRIPGS